MSISKKDNTLRGARNFGRLNGNKRINGLVNQADKIDFAAFRLSGVSELGLTLGRIQGRSSAKITLRNSQGAILQTFKSGPKDRGFKVKLVEGTYYVGVQRLRGTINYKLKASARPAEPGEILSTAREVGVLAGTYTNPEFVGTTDPTDLYRFTLTDNTNLQARVDGLNAGTRVELIRDGNNNGLIDVDEILVSGDDFSAPYLSSITEDLPPGSYYIRVSPLSSTSSTQYQLNLVATPFGGYIPPEPGNTIPVARELGALAGTVTAKEYVGKLDAIDLYRLTLNDISNLQISASGTSNNTRVSLIRDINGNGLIDNDETLATDTNFGSNFLSSVTRDLPAGSYLIAVEPRSASSSTLYDLNVVATPFGGTLPIDPGNTLPAAFEVGALTGTFTAKEHVGILDSTDFYRFTLATPGTLQARVTGASTNTRIQLVRDANNNGLIDNGEILDSDANFGSTFLSQLSESLQAGTYFFGITPQSSSGSTNYTVSLTV